VGDVALEAHVPGDLFEVLAAGEGDPFHHHVDGVADRHGRALADHERGVEGGDLGGERSVRPFAA
jgi:hypothetical protein